MATKLMVTPEKLESTASAVDTQAATFNNVFNKFYQEVDLIKSTQKSEATDSFVNQANGFKNDFMNMEALLKKYTQFLRDAAKDYRVTDSNLANDARSKLSIGR